MDDLTRDRTTACTSAKYKYYLYPKASGNLSAIHTPAVDFLTVNENLTKYCDYLLYDQSIRGTNFKNY